MTATPDIYDPTFVKTVFDRCSRRYIAFSWVMSFGFTERWRRQCVDAMPRPPSPAPMGYDLMAGTGEVWPHLMASLPSVTRIVAVDISSGMHDLAMQRLHGNRDYPVVFVEDDVLRSALPAGSADFVISTFGLKTFDPGQQARLAQTIAHVLKPGGVFSLIEASDPKGWWLRPLFLFHLKVVLPLVERVLLRGAQDFAMIGAYTARFGDASAFGAMLGAQGLEVRFRRHFFGCATGVSGHKPTGDPQ